MRAGGEPLDSSGGGARSRLAEPKRSQTALVVGALGLALLLALAVPSLRPGGLLRDFDAFYCAGRALDAGADPYLAEPLGSCERTPKPAPLLTGPAGLAMPAPLPPFALLPFRALAYLPYVAAAIVWTIAGLAAVALAALTTARLTGLPKAGVIAAFALGDGYAALALGQIAPFAIAALVLAAYCLERQRDLAAAFCTACAMIEPHVGLFAFLSLAFFRPRTRLPLVGLAIGGVALSVLAAGSSITFEYVHSVLPAHALSEVANEKQLSLTYLLHRFGTDPKLALLFGDASYALAGIAGIALGRALASRLGAAALVVIPSAFAVTGGPFVHIIQIAAAVPATLLLIARGSERTRRIAGPALIALAIPWIQFANLGTIFFPLAVGAAAYLCACYVSTRPAAIGAAVVSSLLLLASVVALVRPVLDVDTLMLAHYVPAALAETSWQRYVEAIGSVNAPAFDLAKVPTVVALLAVAVATFFEAAESGASTAHSVALGGNGGAIARRTS